MGSFPGLRIRYKRSYLCTFLLPKDFCLIIKWITSLSPWRGRGTQEARWAVHLVTTFINVCSKGSKVYLKGNFPDFLKVKKIENIMRKMLHCNSWATIGWSRSDSGWCQREIVPSPWNKRMLKLNKIQKDQDSMFSIVKTSETYKSSCFMGTLSKVLPKSILKAQNPLTYGNHYVCSAVYLTQHFLLPSPKESISSPTFTIFYKKHLVASKAQKQSQED